jgi:3-oxoacyl-[acyl-carrier-protein] synthase III
MSQSVITGTGCYIPPHVQTNHQFAEHIFYSENQEPLSTPPEEVVEKFRLITGIEERRYTTDDLNTSDIGALAAENALQDSGTDRETIDQVIVAHNFGNVIKNTFQTDAVPSLASLVKHKLGIKNPNCVAYDVLFGCPGWIQGLIHADAFFKAGVARKALVVGTETLSRVIDIYDRDSMIFSDGAGAVVLEYLDTGSAKRGMLTTASQTYACDEVDFIHIGKSYHPEGNPNIRYIKMKGRKVYEFAMVQVPAAMKACLDKSGVSIQDVKKIFIHQANEKMDDGIIRRFYKLYGIQKPPENIMPMSIHWLGNSSVATIPTLLDLVRKNKVEQHQLFPGDIILFASVGAGMNINAVCYRY